MHLTKPLPEKVLINGVEYAIQTDYRAWLGFISAIQTGDENKVLPALDGLFCEPQAIQHLGNEVLTAVVMFFEGAKSFVNPSDDVGGKKDTSPLYDFEHDANYIYAAFLQQYDIDLINIEHLHYYKFVALLDCLDSETMFCKIKGYRATDLSQIKDKEQKKHARKMQDMFKLPKPKAQQEQEAQAQADFVAKWSL